MEFNNGFYSFAENIQREILVRRVDSVAFQPESHENGLDSQYLFEIRNDGYTASPADRLRFFAESVGKTCFCGAVSRKFYRSYIHFAAIHRRYVYFHRFGRNGLYIVYKQLGNLIVVLVRNQTAGNLCVGFAG